MRLPSLAAAPLAASTLPYLRTPPLALCASDTGDESALSSADTAAPSVATALLILNGVTVLWGSQHAVIKSVVDATGSPEALNAVRFGIAALVALPFAPELFGGDDDSDDTWSAGAELGCWMFAGFALQAVGLQLTSASRSAFLLYLNVKLVPVLAFLLYGRQIAARTWASAAVAVAGTTLLSFDGTPPCAGDGWSLAAALTSAAFILRLERYSSRFDAAALNAATLATTAALCAAWALTAAAFDSAVPGAAELPATLARQAELMAGQAPALLYLSLVTTALANWLQALGQKSVSAQDAAIVYALDPVYGALFAAALLGERLGPQGLAGAALVLAAVALSRGGEEGE